MGDTLVFAESTQFNLCGFDRKLLGHSTAFSDPLLGAKTLRKLKACVLTNFLSSFLLYSRPNLRQ